MVCFWFYFGTDIYQDQMFNIFMPCFKTPKNQSPKCCTYT